jgi:hypothetical protein
MVDGKEKREAVQNHLEPKFKVGDKAPDFTLTDAKKQKRNFAEFVKSAKGDTLLWFTCGCRQCLGLQEYTADLVKKLGSQAPAQLNVTSMQPEREESWVRDTHLKQTILYEPLGSSEDSIAFLYKGKPCPRVFHIRKDQTVAMIGDSVALNPDLKMMAINLAKELGFAAPGTKMASGKLVAPVPHNVESAAGPPSGLPATQSAATAPGADSHAGHNH